MRARNDIVFAANHPCCEQPWAEVLKKFRSEKIKKVILVAFDEELYQAFNRSMRKIY